jgi:hypothetical protein
MLTYVLCRVILGHKNYIGRIEDAAIRLEY